MGGGGFGQSEDSENADLARKLFRASTDSLLDPQVLMEAVRDADGRVIDFVYRELNQATCDYLGLAREDLTATRATHDIVTLTARDVTERFRAAQLLAQARDLRHQADVRYRRLVDNSAIGMGLISPEGRFETANQAMCDFFGYDVETLRGKTWQELTAPAYLDADLRNVRDVAEGRIESLPDDQAIHPRRRSPHLGRPVGELSSHV